MAKKGKTSKGSITERVENIIEEVKEEESIEVEIVTEKKEEERSNPVNSMTNNYE